MFLIVSRTAAWMVAASGRTSAGRPRGSGLAAGPGVAAEPAQPANKDGCKAAADTQQATHRKPAQPANKDGCKAILWVVQQGHSWAAGRPAAVSTYFRQSTDFRPHRLTAAIKGSVCFASFSAYRTPH